MESSYGMVSILRCFSASATHNTMFFSSYDNTILKFCECFGIGL